MWASIKLFTVWFTLGLAAALVGVPWTLLTRNPRWMYRIGQRVCYLGLRAAGIRFHVQGMHNIPRGRACLLMCNHISNLDPPALLSFLPGTPSVMLKSSLMRIPLLGTAMRLCSFVPVDRTGRRDEMERTRRASEHALQLGLPLLVFAEGTRSPTGRLLPFKRGPFHLAQSTGTPVVPMVLFGTEGMMRKGTLRVTPGTAHIHVLPPVDPANCRDRNHLLTAVREAMAAALPEHMRPEAETGESSAAHAPR